MGIIEEELGKTELSDGTSVSVEYNEGDVVHLHIGRFRLNFSRDEFEEFTSAVEAGKNDLLEIKDGL